MIPPGEYMASVEDDGTSDVILEVVVVSSILEETPEGLFRMDRLRRDPRVPQDMTPPDALEMVRVRRR